MPRIRVWAPYAQEVQLQTEEFQHPMQLATDGWWAPEDPFLPPDVDYAFILDNKKPLPDPRSMRQPQGVHGPSRTVDHEAFQWSDSGWRAPPVSSGIFYELHVGTFSPEATFEGIVNRLPYLKDLGVTHLELMPVNGFSGERGWGYDGVNLYAPHEGYGGPNGFKRLVNACHAYGLAVILDVVYNHLGTEGNYLSQFGPYFTDRHKTPWGESINFDGPYSDEVRRFFCDNALMWLRDYHCDGLRIDAVHAITDLSAIHILEQLAEEVETLEAALGRHMDLIAESALNDPRVVQPRQAGGYGIRAQWNDDFHHALHAVLTGERKGYYVDFGRLVHLAKSVQQVFVYDGEYSAFRKRRHGRPVIGLSGNYFLGFLQNHDQVGNRAGGERIGQLISTAKLKIGAALVFASPFIPLLFQGEEWGASTPFQYFTDHGDPALAKAVKKGRCEEFAGFGWEPREIPDPQSKDTFLDSRLNWEELDRQPHQSILAWYRKLIRLRHTWPAMTDGRLKTIQVRFDETAEWFCLKRGPLWVVCNFGALVQNIPMDDQWQGEVVLASVDAVCVDEGKILFPAESVAILSDTTGSHDGARAPSIK